MTHFPRTVFRKIKSNWEVIVLITLITTIGVFRSLFWKDIVLNIDELEWSYLLNRVKENPIPFRGFEGHTSGPISIYFLSIINLFTSYPTLKAIRIFQYVFIIIPTCIIVFKASNFKTRIFSSTFFFLFLISFSPILVSPERSNDDFLAYNTEYQLMLFMGIIYYLQQKINPSYLRITIVIILIWLLLFIKSQSLIFVMYFLLKYLYDLYKFNSKSVKLFFKVNIAIIIAVFILLICFNLFKDFYFEYIVKNFLYSYNSIIESDSLSQFYTFTLFLISDLGINWFLFISVLLLFLVKTFKNSFLNLKDRNLRDSTLLFIITLITLFLSKNNFSHYRVLFFLPSSLLFGELCGIFFDQKFKTFITLLFIYAFGSAFSYVTLKNSYGLEFINPYRNFKKKGIIPVYYFLKANDFNGEKDRKFLINYVTNKYYTGDHIYIFGWFVAQGYYYELLKKYKTSSRSSNTYHLNLFKSHDDTKNYKKEEQNLIYDLNLNKPKVIIDTEEFLIKNKSESIVKFILDNYSLTISSPNYSVWELK